MGTSKGYSMPTGGEWTPLKKEATKFAKSETGAAGESNFTPNLPADLLRRYVGVLGGASGIASGGRRANRQGVAHGGGGGNAGRAAARTGGLLGGFLSGISSTGLSDTLTKVGLAHLIGKSASEVSYALLDSFAGPASTLDDEAARTALLELYNEILENAVTYEEVDQAFSRIIDANGIAKLLCNFFGKYLYRLFCQAFYETWQKKVGEANAKRKLGEIRNYIVSTLAAKFASKDVANEDWSGEAGQRLSEKIMEDTLYVFEVQS